MSSKVSIADRYRTPLLVQLGLLARAGDVADTHSWSDAGWPSGDVAVDFRDQGNAVITLREDAAKRSDVAFRFAALDFDPVRVALQMLDLVSDRDEPISDRHARFYARHLEQLVRATHVLVVVTDRVRLPRLDLDRFEGGHVHGTALLVELTSGELCGGFRYLAESSSSITTRETAIAARLHDDLAARWGASLVAGIQTRFPSSTPPVTFGYVMS